MPVLPAPMPRARIVAWALLPPNPPAVGAQAHCAGCRAEWFVGPALWLVTLEEGPLPVGKYGMIFACNQNGTFNGAAPRVFEDVRGLTWSFMPQVMTAPGVPPPVWTNNPPGFSTYAIWYRFPEVA